MTIWRPNPNIRVKALGLVWQQGLLLASEVTTDNGTVKGVRPLGGTVEFGETWQTALVREFVEELGITVAVTGAPMVFENIYAHEGQTGHEVIFAADVTAPEGAFRDTKPFEYLEDEGMPCRAGWFDVDTLDCGGLALFPAGLKAQLRP